MKSQTSNSAAAALKAQRDAAAQAWGARLAYRLRTSA